MWIMLVTHLNLQTAVIFKNTLELSKFTIVMQCYDNKNAFSGFVLDVFIQTKLASLVLYFFARFARTLPGSPPLAPHPFNPNPSCFLSHPLQNLPISYFHNCVIVSEHHSWRVKSTTGPGILRDFVIT
jgi:hypothetical protein